MVASQKMGDPDVMALVSASGVEMRTEMDKRKNGTMLIQAGLRGRLVRCILDNNGNATRKIETPETPIGQYTVSQTWIQHGALGLAFLPRGGSGGLVVSELKDAALPDTIKSGLLLSANGVREVENIQEEEINAILTTAARPLTLKLRSTPGYAVLSTMLDRFMLADKDGSGALDREEIAESIYFAYRAQKKMRNAAVVQREFDTALTAYDLDGSGILEFREFVLMGG